LSGKAEKIVSMIGNIKDLLETTQIDKVCLPMLLLVMPSVFQSLSVGRDLLSAGQSKCHLNRGYDSGPGQQCHGPSAIYTLCDA
jgi:hypothetical protein